VSDSRDSDYAHLVPLFEKFVSLSPDDPARADLRNALVTGYLPVVQHIARRFAGRGEPVDDLEQAGTVGLLNAVDRFEPDRGVDFLSYAVPTVTGEIRRHFRDRTWAMRVPRRLKDLQSAINSAIGPLSQELGRAPRPSEIAHRLGLSTEEVVEGLDAQQAYRSTSLDELPERERRIRVLRFFGNMTQTQIADRIGISQMHVSRLLAQTVATLRRRMTEEG
jgi:RNA polymerase sigma-B factor